MSGRRSARSCVAWLALAAAVSGLAVAEEAPPEPLTDGEKQLGTAFLSFTSRFGFSRLVGSSRTATGLLFQYLPEEASAEDWRFRGNVLLVRLGEDAASGAAALPRYVEAFESQIQSLNDSILVRSDAGDVAYVDYELGEGTAFRHNLAAIWQAMPGVIAVFQAQRRPVRFDAEQIEQFKLVVLEIAQAPLDPDAAPHEKKPDEGPDEASGSSP